jgi:hypothetical protein
MSWYKDKIGSKLIVSQCKKITIAQCQLRTLEHLTEDDYARGWVWVSPDYPVLS